MIEMKIVNHGSTVILQYLNNIENLDVFTSSILSDKEEFGFITDAFNNLHNLIRLRLTTVNKLSRFNKFLILQSLTSNCKHLKSLVFEINEIIPEETPLHPDFYCFEFPHLREISLKYMQLFTKDEVRHLAESCPQIEIFHISSSSFSDECVTVLVQKLTLTDFLMSNVKDVTDASLENIVQFCDKLEVCVDLENDQFYYFFIFFQVLTINDCLNIQTDKKTALGLFSQIKTLKRITYHHYQDYQYIYMY
jgi:hypothetical protein